MTSRRDKVDLPRSSRTPSASRRGGRTLRRLAVALSLVAATGAARADTLADAQTAFDRGELDRAAQIWREFARRGVPEAAFRLGLISDLGLGPTPGYDEAFRRYLEAADRGHATAQFNVGVMLDAGTGPLWSPSAAATWYARAAAKGFARAEYNLGLLYAEGDGLPRNLGLARAWTARAATTLPAARERLAGLRGLEPAVGEAPVAPVPLSASVVSAADGARSLELVWTASEQPAGTRYRVELDDADDDVGDEGADLLDVSAVAIPLPSGTPRRWRVIATDGERSAASDWQPLSGGESAAPPEGRIAIRFGPNDALARDLAAELERKVTRGGLLRIESEVSGEAEIAESEVRYFHGDDAALARAAATALPVLSGRTVFMSDPGREPGTVEVRLRGAPER